MKKQRLLPRLAAGLLLVAGTAASIPAQAKQIKVTYILGDSTDPFYVSMRCGAQTAAKQLGVSLNVQGAPAWGANLQTPIVNAAVASHPDAMVVVPNDSQAMINPIHQGAATGIKIVLADTSLNDLSFISSRVSSNNVLGGVAAGQILAKLIGYKGSVLVLGYSPGVSTVADRVTGFTKALKKYPHVHDIGNFPDTGSIAGNAQLVLAQISKHPDLSGIFGLSTTQSEAIANAIRQAHKVGKIQSVGFDTAPAEIQMLQKGVVQALIGQKPYDMGIQAVTQAVDAVNGKPTIKFIGTSAVIVTASNYKDPKIAKFLYKESC